MSRTNSISRIWWLLIVGFLLCLPASPGLSDQLELEETDPTTGCDDDSCTEEGDEDETGDDDGEEDPECSEDTDDASVRANYKMYLFPEETGFLRSPVSWAGHGDISRARRLFGFGWEFPFPYGLQYTKDDATHFQVKSTGWNVENFRNTEGSTWVADRWQGDRSSNGPNVSLTVEGDDIVYRRQTKRGGVQTMTMESTWTDAYVPTSLVDSKGRETTFEWVQSLFPTAIQQSVDGQDRRLEFGTTLGLGMELPFPWDIGDYFGMINVTVLSVKDSGDTWDGIEAASSQHVRRACFIYLNQQLVSIEIQVPTVAAPYGHLVDGWEAVSRYVFRYDSQNQLRLVIEPAFYAKFVNSNDYDPADGPGWQVLSGYAGDLDYSVAASYASYAYQYDGNGDVTSVVRKSGAKQCGTGSGKPSSDITVEHTRAANTPAASDVYNEWTTCRVRNFRNAAGDVVKRITKYNNFFQQPIFCMVEEGDDIEANGYDIRHADFYVYDTDGRMIMHAEDSALDWSAIDAYEDDGLADLADDYDDILNISSGASTYLANSEGVIHHKTYGSSTTATTSTAGDVHGQVKEKKIQIGDGGSITTLVDFKYKLFTKLSGEQVAVAVEERRYVGSDGTYEKVTFAHALLDLDDDTNDDSQQKTTTRYVRHAKMSGETETFYTPDGTVDGSGSTKTLVTIAIRDGLGRSIWVKDEIGLIDYYEYDESELAKRIEDLDTSETGDFADLPSGWSTNGTYGGLHLVTNYSYDELGRVTQVLGPEHKIDIGGTLTAVRSAKWVVLIEDGPTALDERWTLEGYQKISDSDNVVVGPIKAELLCKLDRAMATVLLTTDAFTDDDSDDLPDPGELELVNEGAGDETKNWLACTTVSFDGDGELAWRKVFHTIPADAPADVDSWGSFGSASDYMKTGYEYDDFAMVSKVTDPESKDTFIFHGVASVSIDGATEVFFEKRKYPHVYNDGGYKLAGPIGVTWTTAEGELARNFLATATITGATPTGTETLTELARRSYTRDDYGYMEKTQTYFDLPGNWNTGTEGTNFYESENLAYTLDGRLLRSQDTLGTISAMVYDGLGRAVTQWLGTDATGATRTDPEGSGGNDLVKVGQSFYDLDGDGTGTLVPYLTRRESLKPLTTLAGTSADYTGIDYKPYDGTDTLDGFLHLRSKVEPDVGADMAIYFDGVARRRMLTFANGSTANSLSGRDAVPGPGDRIVERWASDAQTGGSLANRWDTRLETTFDYDDAGRVVTETSPTGLESKSDYDAAGRRTRTYLVAGQYSSADLVIQESVAAYDDVGNVTEQILYRRDDGNTTAGGLLSSQGTSISQNSYVYKWYDNAHRLVNEVNYGVQASDPAPGSVPAFADARIRTDYAYNSAGRLLTVKNNREFIAKHYYDDLGRSTCKVENFVAAEFDTEPTGLNTPDLNSRDADECRTTTYSYDAGNQILTMTAMDPNADGTETDNQVTTYVYSGQLSSYTSPVKREDLLIGMIYPDSDDEVVSQALDDGTDTDYDRVELEYNAAGSVAQRKDQREVEIDYTYYDDGGKKLQAVTLPGGSAVDDTVLSIENVYNDLGQLTRVTSYDDALGSAGTSNEVNEVVLAYNDWGQVATSWQEHSGAATTTGGSQSPKVQYEYYAAAESTYSYEAGEMDLRLEYVVYPNGRKVHYTYGANDSFADYLSRVDAIREDDGSGDPGNALAEYTFMGAKTLVKRTSPTTAITDGLELNFGAAADNYDGFDNLGRVVDLTWQDLGGTPSIVHQFEYSYDRNSNPLAEDGYDDVWLPFGQTKIVDFSYTYDDLDRLTEARQGDLDGNSSIADADVDQIRKYTLDQLGNWTDLDIGHYDGGFVWDAEQGRTYTAGGANEITATTGHNAETFEHDAAGNSTEALVGMQVAGPMGLQEMVYDAWNRLVTVGTSIAKYRYDGLGRKVRNLDVIGPPDLDYYYNNNWQLLEMQLTLNPQPTLYQYVWCARYIDAVLIRDEDDDLGTETDSGGGDLGVSGSGLETRQFYLQDAGYTTRYTLLDDATMGQTVEFSAYGDMLSIWIYQGSVLGSSLPGMWHGTEWALSAANHHVRNRTFNIATGRWLQRDPFEYHDGMNLYEYVGSRPSSAVDPFGLFEVVFMVPPADECSAGQTANTEQRIRTYSNCGDIEQSYDYTVSESVSVSLSVGAGMSGGGASGTVGVGASGSVTTSDSANTTVSACSEVDLSVKVLWKCESQTILVIDPIFGSYFTSQLIWVPYFDGFATSAQRAIPGCGDDDDDGDDDGDD